MSDVLRVLAVFALVRGARRRDGEEVQVGDVRLQVEQLDGHRITRLLVRIDGGRSHSAARDHPVRTVDRELSDGRITQNA
jgi:hypothetical protein